MNEEEEEEERGAEDSKNDVYKPQESVNCSC